ncbi:MAG: ribonucleoside triphosphate reductase [Thermotogae bacterium]|nr:ribonucleoside triphosphate reductase [Thermotogota bacterium]
MIPKPGDLPQPLSSQPLGREGNFYVCKKHSWGCNKMNEVKTSKMAHLVELYILERDWTVRENANMNYSLQGLNQFVHSRVIKEYWLEEVYTEKIARYHEEGYFHIHDLGSLSAYCVGWDLFDLLRRGFGGVYGKVSSKPPKHLSTALLQIVNFIYTLQGEVAGAVAFSNFDTFLAPFVRYDGISYAELKQLMQEFIFNMNVPTRVGFQAPFSNLTFDLKVPRSLANRRVIVGGEEKPECYASFQREMNMINRAFVEVMMEGDASNRPFSFPIPTYNVTRDFEWDNEITDMIMEMTARYGTPYFANYISSDMDPDDVRSMCCRLRLDNRKVHEHLERMYFNLESKNFGKPRKRGGMFASHPLTGSIGVVTINLPRLMYLARGNEGKFFQLLDDVMETARDSLEIKREYIERFTEMGLYPYSAVYLEPVREMVGKYWSNHFSTIGIVGMHEGLLNFGIEGGIVSQEGKRFAVRILEFMRTRTERYSRETGNLYNLEATPAESASYRLARLDISCFPDIITSGDANNPYYTNSSQPPVNFSDNPFEIAEHQEELQAIYTGGTVVHFFVGEKLEDVGALKMFIRRIFETFSLPYITITPTFSVCPVHGYIPGEEYRCPICGEETEVYSRVVGYYRPIRNWNDGKRKEFEERKVMNPRCLRT